MKKLVTNELSLGLDQKLRNDLIDNFKKLQNGVDGQSDALNKQIKDLLGDVPLQDQNEVTQARIDANGKQYQTMKTRLDVDQATAETALEEERDTNAELVEARGGFKTLGLHETAQDNSIETKAERSDVAIKADKTYVDSLISALESGAPKGMFYSLKDLKKKYPNGTTGVYLVFDSSFNGSAHSFVWNKDNKTWKDLGEYQASITVPRMRNGNIITNGPFNINTETWNLEFADAYAAVTDAYTQYRINVATFALPNDTGFLWYNTTDEVLVTTSKASEALDSFVYLGAYFKNSKTFTISGDYLVDGYKIATTKELPLLVYPAQLLSTKKVIVDRVGKKLIFEDGQTIAIQVGNQRFKPKVVGTEMDLSENNANYLFFDSINNKIITQTSYISSSNDLAYLGYINFGNNFAVDLNANYMVKDYSVAAKYAGQSFAALGDSTVNGDNGQGKTSNSWSWVAYISYLCGFSDVDNVGVNGSRVTKGTRRDDSLVERYDQIKDKDFVAVMAGVNDFINNMTLGEINTIGSKFDITTFYGAYQTVVEGLKKNNPNAKLLLITSMKVNNDRANSFTENGIGLKQKDYINAIKEIGEMYGIRVHDLYAGAGFSPFLDSDSIYTADKLHPTELGYKVLASQIAGTINAM